jgi:hypothetical protein
LIEWLADLAVGMRFKSPPKVATREEIKQFTIAVVDEGPHYAVQATA